MTQHQLDHHIADVTGETVAEIEHLGFRIADPDVVAFDPQPEEGSYVDWDVLDASRDALFPAR